jgi:hypothetical protein
MSLYKAGAWVETGYGSQPRRIMVISPMSRTAPYWLMYDPGDPNELPQWVWESDISREVADPRKAKPVAPLFKAKPSALPQLTPANDNSKRRPTVVPDVPNERWRRFLNDDDGIDPDEM